jgi:hypothetical protein
MPMIVEMRLYTIYVGKAPEFVRLYETQGLPVQIPACGAPLGMYQTEFGPMSQVMLLWRYASHADRDARRAALMADPAWMDFLKAAAPLVQQEESRLLLPTAWQTAHWGEGA